MAGFFRRGTSEIHFLPAVTGSSPTRAEITAGTDLTAQVMEISGFQLTNSPIPTPVLGSAFTTSIPGEDTTPDSALTFLDDVDAPEIRTALAKDTAGFIVLFPYGDVPTERCEVFAVISTGVNDEWSIGNDPARFQVGFAVTEVPEQNGVIPSAV